ncbi:hypothetical protein [Streptococcus sp. DD12]|uniref:hypothetical protein n=1 Tax=Streptococcus sp. DD12 TaxID=1777880 RepID=UPI000795A454|nr:hypothetical protein [Streptococcus sp. DD12]KXT75958.1 hypothetical protein STRDD12_01070 [Streptococcus sp. DD12]
MNQQDWQEYFEAINGRPATVQEIQQAIASGEIDAPQSQAVQGSTASEYVQPQGQAFTQQAQASQTVAGQEPPVGAQATFGGQAYAHPGQAGFDYAAFAKQPNPVGQAFVNYFKWFAKGFYKPEATDTESHPVFGIITTVIIAIIGAGVLRNFFVTIFSGLLTSLATNSVSLYSGMASLIGPRVFANIFGFGTYFAFLALLLIGYFGPIALSRILKDANYPNDNYWQRLGRAFGYFPLILAVNFLALLFSFMGTASVLVYILIFLQLVVFSIFMASLAIGANQGVAKLSKGLTTLLTMVAVSLIVTLIVVLVLATVGASIGNYLNQASNTFAQSFSSLFGAGN